jgi:hypothetical protein
MLNHGSCFARAVFSGVSSLSEDIGTRIATLPVALAGSNEICALKD